MIKVVTISSEELMDLVEKVLRKVLNETPKKIDEDVIMKRKEVALLLRISLVTLNEWMRSGKIPYYRINSRIYFKKVEILKCLSR